MAWERKRGKLEQFNRLLLGGSTAAFSLHEGEPRTAGRRPIRRHARRRHRAAARRAAAARGHPRASAQPGRVRPGDRSRACRLHRDPATRRDLARERHAGPCSRGCSRAIRRSTSTAAPSPTSIRTCSARESSSARASTTCGAFSRSLDGRVPENALASHDLFEGVHGRAALATDVVLYEDFPRQLPRVHPTPAPLGARRLAAPAVARAARARCAAGRVSQPSVVDRSLEDPRQPAPKPAARPRSS